jgi:hypothetical protein
MQKIKVVIEVELIEYEQLTEVSRALQAADSTTSVSQPTSSEEQADLLHGQTLLELLRADPASYAEFVKNRIVSSLESLEVHRQLASLANLKCSYSAGLDVLTRLLPQLPSSARLHFQQASQQGWMSEGTDLLFGAVQANPISLTVEFPR